jgi:hypothetical protein
MTMGQSERSSNFLLCVHFSLSFLKALYSKLWHLKFYTVGGCGGQTQVSTLYKNFEKISMKSLQMFLLSNFLDFFSHEKNINFNTVQGW